jgi:hypothetical protein
MRAINLRTFSLIAGVSILPGESAVGPDILAKAWC